jgi:hypothetical protein
MPKRKGQLFYRVLSMLARPADVQQQRPAARSFGKNCLMVESSSADPLYRADAKHARKPIATIVFQKKVKRCT